MSYYQSTYKKVVLQSPDEAIKAWIEVLKVMSRWKKIGNW